MTETGLSPELGKESIGSMPSPKSFPIGARFATPSPDSTSKAQDTTVYPEHQTGITPDLPSEAEQKTLGPSAFEGTERPFLARVFDINTTEIRDLGLRDQLAEVDSYILALVKERNWVDTEGSYRDVLEELRTNLGFHRNLEPLRLLSLLSDGVRLLKLQKMHRRRDADIQRAIQRLNEK